MLKLASPVQYESPLKGLNDVRPLQLADVGKIVLPTSVLCKNLPTANKPAVGVLAKCTQQGALLRDNTDFADKVFEDSIDLPVGEGDITYIFPMRVQGVLAKYYTESEVGIVYWSTGELESKLLDISQSVWTFLPFVGKEVSFGEEGLDPEETIVYIKGFYK